MNLNPQQLELAVLSSIKTIEDFNNAREAGIDEDSFQVEQHIAVWDYFTKRATESIPSPKDVLINCDVSLIEGVTDKETPLLELSKITMARKARRIIIDNGKNLEGNPVQVIRDIIGDLSSITTTSSTSTTSFFDANAGKRLAEVLRRIELRNRGQAIGIPTGLPIFDQNDGMFQPGEVIAIIGTTNIGKSWLLLYFCANAYWFSRKKVLFLSPESTIFDTETRLDPILGRFMGYELSNRAIRYGYIHQETYNKYLTQLMSSGRHDMIVRDSGDSGVFTINDIISQAREHRPDILAIDGFHLIKGMGKSWENIKDAAEQLKGQAQQMGMTILAASQGTRSTSMAIDDTPEIGEMAYGMGLGEAANRIITLASIKGNPNQRIFKCPKMRDGEKILDRQYLRFEVDTGNIEQITPEIDSHTGVVTL